MPQHLAPRPRTLSVLTACVALSVVAMPATAQRHGASVSVNAADSVALIVPRRAPVDGESFLRTRDRSATLILRDTVVVLQLTERGMEKVFANDTTPRDGAAAIFARMMKAGIEGVLDHGIAYRLSALRAARADGSSLVLEDKAGKHVFESTELNGTHPMQDFEPGEAERFARLVQRAIAARR